MASKSRAVTRHVLSLSFYLSFLSRPLSFFPSHIFLRPLPCTSPVQLLNRTPETTRPWPYLAQALYILAPAIDSACLSPVHPMLLAYNLTPMFKLAWDWNMPHNTPPTASHRVISCFSFFLFNFLIFLGI